MAKDDFLNLDPEDERLRKEKEEKDKMILGKFKTAEDLTKAYSDLEADHTKRAQELADAKREAEEAKAKLAALPAPVVQPAKGEEEDLNTMFFTEPAVAVEKVIKKFIEPLYSNVYAQEKAALKSDPEFATYEAEIDTIVNNMPQLKTQPGIVNQLFKMVKGLHFDPVKFEADVREKIKTESDDKTKTGLEGGSPPGLPNRDTKVVQLSDEEKLVAHRFHPELPLEEAYKKYGERKKKWGGKE